MSNYELDDKRTQLDIWLRKSRMTRKQFAEEFGVSEATAYGWLSNTNIPLRRWDDIRAFFLKKGVVEEKPKWEWRAIPVLVTSPEAKRMEEAAAICGEELKDFIRRAALEETKRILGEI